MRDRREQSRIFKTFAVPLRDLGVSDSVDSFLIEDPEEQVLVVMIFEKSKRVVGDYMGRQILLQGVYSRDFIVVW